MSAIYIYMCKNEYTFEDTHTQRPCLPLAISAGKCGVCARGLLSE